ncbi:MAG: hypothetical protein U0787_11970 [Polyangia bacterium]
MLNQIILHRDHLLFQKQRIAHRQVRLVFDVQKRDLWMVDQQIAHFIQQPLAVRGKHTARRHKHKRFAQHQLALG